jgi:AraC-like DNA-binding protein
VNAGVRHPDAAEAAFQVGYESPSQFSREYRRMYTTPAGRDLAVFQAEAQLANSPAV